VKEFAEYLKVERFPKKKSFKNIAPIIEKIQESGYDIHLRGNYFGIWRNCSRGYRELFFSLKDRPVDSAYTCCINFIKSERKRNEIR